MAHRLFPVKCQVATLIPHQAHGKHGRDHARRLGSAGVALMGNIGGVAGLPYLGFVGGVAVILFVFAKKLRDSRGFTLPDYMGDRFDSTFLRGFSAVVVGVSSIIYLIAQIRVMGFILEELIGVSFLAGMFVGTAVFVFYVAIGGLLAVVWTNIAQFVFMFFLPNTLRSQCPVTALSCFVPFANVSDTDGPDITSFKNGEIVREHRGTP